MDTNRSQPLPMATQEDIGGLAQRCLGHLSPAQLRNDGGLVDFQMSGSATKARPKGDLRHHWRMDAEHLGPQGLGNDGLIWLD